MYLQIYNKNTPYQTRIVNELSDFLFEEGWRILNVRKYITGLEYLQMDEENRQDSIRQNGW